MPEKEDLAFGTDAPLHEVMSTMRAMRRLKPDPVPRELLEQMVEAATWAPSGGNQQQYSWVVVTEREKMEQLAELRGEVTSKRDPARGELRRPDA